MSTWGRWGDDDERGALNHLTPERVAAAAGLVRDGISGHHEPAAGHRPPLADNPEPAEHRMTRGVRPSP